MLYYQIEICIHMYKHVYWLCAPHSYNPMGCPSSRIHPGASARVHPHKLRARKNRLSTPCGASSRFIIYEIRSVDMHRIIPRILYASSS